MAFNHKDNVSRTHLINLVFERPELWDKEAPNYRDKEKRKQSWREICVILKDNIGEDFDSMPLKARNEFGKLVMRTWNFTRDCWVRSLNNLKKGNSVKPYRYHDQMLFLEKAITHIKRPRDGEEKEEDETDTSNSKINVFSIRTNRKITEDYAGHKRKRTTERANIYCQEENKEEIGHAIDIDNTTIIKETDIDNQTQSTTQTKPKTQHVDRHLSFFNSIQPTLSLFNDDQTLEFQAGVINLLQKIKRGRNNTVSADPLQSLSRKDYSHRSRISENVDVVSESDDEKPVMEYGVQLY